MPAPATTIDVDGFEIRVSNPDKVLFAAIGVTKMELVESYLAVADAALIGCRDRPTIMHRFPNGVDGEPFYQKRVPTQRPPWVQTATITFPSGRHAVMIAPADAAHLAWMANLACIDLNPWPVRRDDVDHPDELRVDLDPTPDVPWDDVRRVTLVVREVLEEHGAVGFPATSGKRGMHLVVPIVREHGFTMVRRAALALAREVTRRAPGVATAAWWKEERQGVFVDYNQNARDRTVASAYSVRPVPDARVAAPLSWDEVADVDPSAFTIRTVPERLASTGDPGAGADPAERSRLDGLLELAARDEAGGLGDAPWPPHFPKGDSEPVRVNPSRARKVAEWEASRRATKSED
ncbi:MAG: DNA polymerase domain-containing protein [Actinomycetota bacterium]